MCYVRHKIIVLELPIDITKDLASQEVFEKEDATFTCELSKPNQPVDWYIGTKKIKPSEKYELEVHDFTYTLKIKDCTLNDTAEVSIVAKDCKSTAQLVVKGLYNILTAYSIES